MPAASRRSIIALWLVLGLAPQAFAQELCLVPEPLDLTPAPVVESDDDDASVDETLEIVTSRIDGVSNSEATFGDVEIRYGEGTITAQGASIERDGEFDLLGRVEVTAPGVLVYGEDAHYDPDAETVSLSAAGFDLPTRPARGSAGQIEVTSDSRISLASMLFTTCPPENVAWEISAKSAELDVNGGVGTARGVKLDFKGVPVLYVPYFSFPINDQRKSGFLTPAIGERRPHGLRRGRALLPEPRAELRPDARRRATCASAARSSSATSAISCPTAAASSASSTCRTTRRRKRYARYANLQHESLFGRRDQFEILSGVEGVSDDGYFEDLGSSLAVTSQTHLNRFLDLTLFAPNWSVLTRFQNYQTIDPELTDHRATPTSGSRRSCSAAAGAGGS